MTLTRLWTRRNEHRKPGIARRVTAVSAALSCAALTAVGVAAPASAAEARPAGCPPDPGYSFTSPAHNFTDMVSSAEGGSGVHLSITLTSGRTVSTTLTGTLETSESLFIESASLSLSLAVESSITTSVSYGGDWTVPSTWSVGYLHAGADRESVNWTYGSYNGACTWIVARSGTANMPYHVPAFWHNKQATGGANVN